jgi:hypothetical protein
MSNLTNQTMIVKNGGETIGYLLPGESCLLSDDALVSMGQVIPDEDRDNVMEI